MVQLTGFTGENQELEECEIRNLIGVDKLRAEFMKSSEKLFHSQSWKCLRVWQIEGWFVSSIDIKSLKGQRSGEPHYQVLPGNYDIQLFQVFI